MMNITSRQFRENRTARRFRLVSKPSLLIVAVLAIAIAAFGAHRVMAQTVQDCSANSIIKCGTQTPADFIAKLKANNPADLQAIYSDFTLTPDKYDDFAQNAKMGTAYKNGNLVVNGQTVATNAWSIGRDKQSYSTDDAIGGKTYYKSYNKDVFVPDSIPAMVYFNSDGNVQFAVLTACGNPLGGTPNTNHGTCDLLQKTAVKDQPNTYTFTTKATAANGAKVTKVVYDFGDGTPTVTMNDPSAPTPPHTYATPGTYTAKVTAYISNANGVDVPVTATTCQTQIVVQQVTPPATVACSNLQATVDQNNYLSYIFTATTTANNATLKTADFDFGDGSKAPGVGPVANAPTTSTVQHTYASAGTYTVVATVHFAVTGQNGQATVQDATCQTQITIKQPAPVTPAAQTLPNTGPAGIAGIFGGASALGAAGYRWRLRRKTHLVDNLVDKLRGQR